MERVERELLKVEEVAEILGVGRTKAYQMAAGGELPVLRIGRLRRISRTALHRWIVERTARAA